MPLLAEAEDNGCLMDEWVAVARRRFFTKNEVFRPEEVKKEVKYKMNDTIQL